MYTRTTFGAGMMMVFALAAGCAAQSEDAVGGGNAAQVAASAAPTVTPLATGDAQLLASIVDETQRGPDGEPYRLILTREGDESRVFFAYGKAYEIWRGKGVSSLAQVATNHELDYGQGGCSLRLLVEVSVAGGTLFNTLVTSSEDTNCTLEVKNISADGSAAVLSPVSVFGDIDSFNRDDATKSFELGASGLRVFDSGPMAERATLTVVDSKSKQGWKVDIEGAPVLDVKPAAGGKAIAVRLDDASGPSTYLVERTTSGISVRASEAAAP